MKTCCDRCLWSCFPVFALTSLLMMGACATTGAESAANDPDEREWIELFNGRDLAGWTVKVHRHDVGVNFGNTFRVEDGIIQVRYDEYDNFDDQFSHLFYDEPFSHYLVLVDYRFTGEVQRGAPDFVLLNSGIMLHSQDPRTMPRDQDWPISVEMQFYAEVSPDQPRPTGNMCSPGTHVEIDGQLDTRHCINASGRALPRGAWVTAEALVLGDSIIKHIVNGDTVLVYGKPQIGGGVVNRYDPAIKQDGRVLSEGFIALQSEGQPIDFRNVRLLDLSGCTDPAASNYKTYFLRSDNTRCRY
jgi:hypothetical protein